jgi:[acyl-carrier-protein] S-malonyltransferase
MQLVALRGRLMSEAGQEQEGGMLAVLRLDQVVLQQIVEQARQESGGVLCIANYNSPQQLVLSGSNSALQAAKEQIKAQRGKAIALPVSGAFHSSLMQEAAQELAAYMQRLHWHAPRITLHLNQNARAEDDPQVIAKAMQKQMISPVLWLQLVEEQWCKGVRNWFELGPRDVLSKLLKYCLQDKEKAWGATKVDSLQAVQGMLGRD